MTEVELVRNWPAALAVLVELVNEAEKQSERVWVTPEGPNKRMEITSWNLDMGMARGALIALNSIWPGNEALQPLRDRLNNCPLVSLAGKAAAGIMARDAAEQSVVA